MDTYFVVLYRVYQRDTEDVDKQKMECDLLPGFTRGPFRALSTGHGLLSPI